MRARVCVYVCVRFGSMSEWLRRQWTIRKTDVIIKSIRIWQIAPSLCSPQPVFQRYHCVSASRLEHNHSLSSFFLVKSTATETSCRDHEDSLAHPYVKESPWQVPEAPQNTYHMKGSGAAESKQISSWLFVLPLGLWSLISIGRTCNHR